MYVSGIDPTDVSATAKFALGTIAFNAPIGSTAGAKGYMYVQDSGSGITGAGYVVDIDGSAFTAVMTTTTTAAPGTGTGKPVGVAQAAFTASYYGWVQICGPSLIRVSASCAAYTRLNTTATAGQLDDDGTAGARVINGIVLDVARAASAGTAAGVIVMQPSVGVTL